jgi:menaquinone-dependent protoporphyrinogen IX oxidase
MTKTLIMYFTKYGTTKKYAEWIAAELDGDIKSIKIIKDKTLENYDTIILGSGLYAGKIAGVNILIKNYEKIKNKKIVIFTCGLADYSKMENINSVNKRLEKELPRNIKENVKIFYLRGGINYRKISLIHKIMMRMLKKMIMKKGIENLNEENKEFLETYGQKVDFVDKNSIIEIIKYCK